jgi:hypothetical protein
MEKAPQGRPVCSPKERYEYRPDVGRVGQTIGQRLSCQGSGPDALTSLSRSTHRSVRPGCPPVDGKILGIATGADIRLALFRLKNLGVYPMFLCVGHGRLFAVKTEAHLRLRVSRRGPPHQRINRPRARRSEIQKPFLCLGLSRRHRRPGRLVNACPHSAPPVLEPLMRDMQVRCNRRNDAHCHICLPRQAGGDTQTRPNTRSRRLWGMRLGRRGLLHNLYSKVGIGSLDLCQPSSPTLFAP